MAAAQFNEKCWRRVGLTVDSGAGRSAMDPDTILEYQLRPSEGSRGGQQCLGSGNEGMDNLSEKKVPPLTSDGVGRLSTFQGVKVRKPLLAVSASCDQKQLVLLDNDGSHILDGIARRVRNSTTYCANASSNWNASPRRYSKHAKRAGGPGSLSKCVYGAAQLYIRKSPETKTCGISLRTLKGM